MHLTIYFYEKIKAYYEYIINVTMRLLFSLFLKENSFILRNYKVECIRDIRL